VVVHATAQDLAGWLDGETPPEAARLLARASRLVDRHVYAGYRVDDDGLPVDEHVRDALRDATCAQVEQWLAVGEDHDVEGVEGAVSVGGASFTLPPSLAPRARRELVLASLQTVTAI
jgi:hypothetical protein